MTAVQGVSAPARVRTPERVGRHWAKYLRRGILYVLATFGAIVFMAPFLFAISSSLKTVAEIHLFPPTFLPAQPAFENYARLFNIPGVYFARWYLNSLIISVLAVIGTVLTASAAAYGFSRFRWRGRDFCFLVLLSTLVLPEEVVIIPKFLLFHYVPLALFGHTWIDTWWPLIVPYWFGGGAFSVFLLRQFFLQIPHDLDEAATIDGANSWQILWKILLPLAQPAVATVAIFSFLTHWNDFFHPLIYLSTVENFPLAVGLRWFQQNANDPTEPREHLLMAASMLMVLPCVLIFFTMQRYFVRGIVMSGIKG
jgi:ABC-type glycerol-3-phosphate transport system permease component